MKPIDMGRLTAPGKKRKKCREENNKKQAKGSLHDFALLIPNAAGPQSNPNSLTQALSRRERD